MVTWELRKEPQSRQSGVLMGTGAWLFARTFILCLGAHNGPQSLSFLNGHPTLPEIGAPRRLGSAWVGSEVCWYGLLFSHCRGLFKRTVVMQIHENGRRFLKNRLEKIEFKAAQVEIASATQRNNKSLPDTSAFPGMRSGSHPLREALPRSPPNGQRHQSSR